MVKYNSFIWNTVYEKMNNHHKEINLDKNFFSLGE